MYLFAFSLPIFLPDFVYLFTFFYSIFFTYNFGVFSFSFFLSFMASVYKCCLSRANAPTGSRYMLTCVECSSKMIRNSSIEPIRKQCPNAWEHTVTHRLLNINWKLRVQRSSKSAWGLCMPLNIFVPYGKSNERSFALTFPTIHRTAHTLSHSRHCALCLSFVLNAFYCLICTVYQIGVWIFDSLSTRFIFSPPSLNIRLWRTLSLKFSFFFCMTFESFSFFTFLYISLCLCVCGWMSRDEWERKSNWECYFVFFPFFSTDKILCLAIYTNIESPQC